MRSQDEQDPHSATLMNSDYSNAYSDAYRHHWWWRARERTVLRAIASAGVGRDKSARILDVGCGDGLLWPQLHTFGEVDGIEPDPLLVPENSPYRNQIEMNGVLESQKAPATYDLILMLDVLEHIEDDGAALRWVNTRLREGGTLILTVPALHLLWSEFDVMTGHFRRYDRRSLATVVRSAGMQIAGLRYAYAWTVAPLLVRRALYRGSSGHDSAFVRAPPTPVNMVLRTLSHLDHRVGERVRIPFGSSLLAVARKPANPGFQHA